MTFLWVTLTCSLKAKTFFNSLITQSSLLGEALRPSLQQLCANVLGYLNTKGLYPSLKVSRSTLTVNSCLEKIQ